MNVRDRVAKRRAELRAQGLRPVQLWVPDLNNPDVVAEIKRECAVIREFDRNDDTLDFFEPLMAWPEDDE